MKVLEQWFSYRRLDRSRPMIGDRRPPSDLGLIQPEGWLADYTMELFNVLHVLGRLVLLEPAQADLPAQIVASPLLSEAQLSAAGVRLPGTEARRGFRNARCQRLAAFDALFGRESADTPLMVIASAQTCSCWRSEELCAKAPGHPRVHGTFRRCA
ncbi:hypothetical protein [Caulobacter sp. 17J80-11]|uniref:hypothetical protein n=1 Tax=Caulobacter sp. 17J80-11 TaxID=2763502 RepID=UPI001653D79D|nr:hypothetical protein [Caulobacter sp. 17J80-11]MBC6983418.1 hypothetical protein [Caulobacter sp. 17J80-11]